MNKQSERMISMEPITYDEFFSKLLAPSGIILTHRGLILLRKAYEDVLSEKEQCLLPKPPVSLTELLQVLPVYSEYTHKVKAYVGMVTKSESNIQAIQLTSSQRGHWFWKKYKVTPHEHYEIIDKVIGEWYKLGPIVNNNNDWK